MFRYGLETVRIAIQKLLRAFQDRAYEKIKSCAAPRPHPTLYCMNTIQFKILGNQQLSIPLKSQILKYIRYMGCIILLSATHPTFLKTNSLSDFNTNKIHTEKPQLTLYYADYCPYSHKVLRYLKHIHKKVPMKDVSRHSHVKEELKRIGGKAQVPCLVIDGKALYESDAIIEWLSHHKDALDSTQ